MNKLTQLCWKNQALYQTLEEEMTPSLYQQELPHSLTLLVLLVTKYAHVW